MTSRERVAPAVRDEEFGRLSSQLTRGIELAWRYAPGLRRRPAAARLAGGRVWDPQAPGRLVANAPNWFWTTFTFPETLHGLPLTGRAAYLYFNGYCPFTLWVDGCEQFREQHVWYATGPLADPIVTTIEPGRAYQLLLCLEPTEVPFKFNPLQLAVVPLPVVELNWELTAVWGELKMAAALAADESERTLVERAAVRVDLAALEAGRCADFRCSVAAAEAVLAPLAPRAKAHTVHLFGHTHIDMDWQWTWTDTLHCIRRDAQAVLGVLDDYPEVTFTLSQIPIYAAVREHDPGNFARIREYIRQGRWENVAATWVECDLNLVDGESLARQVLYAADWSRAQLGQEATCFWAPDTFGHPGNLPQIARLAGCDTYFHWRCNPGGELNQPAHRWIGIDGSEVLAISSAYGGALLPGPGMFLALHNTLDSVRLGLDHSHHVWGLGDHGGGMPRHQLRLFQAVRDRPLLPTFRFSSLSELGAALRQDPARLPVNRGETHTLFEGCYTAHARMKVCNRRCESALLTAEAATALAGLDRNAALREAWTPVLFSQFHDIYCGCAVHGSYEDAYRRADSALATAATVTHDALAVLAPECPDGGWLTLLNPLGFAWEGPCEVALPETVTALALPDGTIRPVQPLGGGRSLFVAGPVPAFGRSDLRLMEGRVEAGEAVQVRDEGYYFTIETPLYRCRLARNSGVLASWFDRRLNRELVAQGEPRTLQHVQSSRAEQALNVFHLLDEAPNPMTAWLINDILRQENLLRDAEVTLIDTGPVCARFRVVHRFRHSRIEEELRLYRTLARAEFDVRLDWQETGDPQRGIPHLKLGFAAGMTAARVRGEGPYTLRETPANGVEQVTQKWVDLTGDEFGFTLLNDSRYGYDASGGHLRVSLVRNSYSPDPDSDRGEHRFRFAFMPHGPAPSPAELWRQGMRFNRPLLAQRTDASVGTASVGAGGVGGVWRAFDDGGSVVCTALRRSEHDFGAVLLRFFETAGQPVHATLHVSARYDTGQEVNLQEAPLASPLRLDPVLGLALTFRPYEIKTVRLQRGFLHSNPRQPVSGPVLRELP